MKLQNLFNLKINTMQKISILTVIVAATALILLIPAAESKAQDKSGAIEFIHNSAGQFVSWYNAGQVDSLLTMYADDACILAMGCGKSAIRNFYTNQVNLMKFTDIHINSISVADSIAVEKGRWTVDINGAVFRGEYMTEWRCRNKRWFIVNDISDNY
jgi:ketosteroid isomerase-like protein